MVKAKEDWSIDCYLLSASSVDDSSMPLLWCSPSTGVEYIISEDGALYSSASFPGLE